MESMSLQGERGVVDARNGYNVLILLNIKLSETNERKDPSHLSAHARGYRSVISNAGEGYSPPATPYTASAQ
jgi:hypothetical protein